MAAQRSFPEPGVLDPGDQFWLEAMADAVLILSPVYGPRRQVTDFRVDYANAAATELADDPALGLRPGALVGTGFLNLDDETAGALITALRDVLSTRRSLRHRRTALSHPPHRYLDRAGARRAHQPARRSAAGHPARRHRARGVGAGHSQQREEPPRPRGRRVRRGAHDRRPRGKRAELEHRREPDLRVRGRADDRAALFGALSTRTAGQPSRRESGRRSPSACTRRGRFARMEVASGRAFRLLPCMATTASCAASSR